MLDEYNYTETESGRSETLVKAIERIEVLERKLNIAMDTLHEILNDDLYNTDEDAAYIRDQLKEIENVQ